MVSEGEFREDLWYRIAVFPIVLPPLRQRREDIPELARHFAQRASKRFGMALVRPTEADVRLLSTYDWPGNVRELAAVMDRAAILGNGMRLEVGKALGVAAALPAMPCREESFRAKEAATSTGMRSLDEAVRGHIEAALALSRGRVEGPGGAAALLCVNPNTLRAKMRKLGIDWKRFRLRQRSDGS
jgi:transcriptional regulator with GAF, ATPase, and Fis domain